MNMNAFIIALKEVTRREKHVLIKDLYKVVKVYFVNDFKFIGRSTQ